MPIHNLQMKSLQSIFYPVVVVQNSNFCVQEVEQNTKKYWVLRMKKNFQNLFYNFYTRRILYLSKLAANYWQSLLSFCVLARSMQHPEDKGTPG